ncbi:MAG: hypothetical protein RIC06_15070 [Cyclobacteriaceae bacterium]
MKKHLLIYGLLFMSYGLHCQDLSVISWNIESGGAKAEGINNSINTNWDLFKDVDVWGFSEVDAEKGWAYAIKDNLEQKSGKDFWFVVGNTGSSDRLMVVFDQDKYEMVDKYELYHINIGGSVRAPLVVQLKEKNGNKEFLFMVNHLYRTNPKARQQQAKELSKWVQDQSLPVVAVGDYNFDYSLKPDGKKGNTSFKHFIKGDHWIWVEPAIKVMTQCNTFYNSILDFVFVNDDAAGWLASSEVIVIPGDCPDSDETPDHRPVIAQFEF